MKTFYFLLISFGLLFTACKKGELLPTNPGQMVESPIIAGHQIVSSLGGLIVNEMGQGVEGVHVQLGDKSTQTDENGIFLIKNVLVQSDLAFVKAEKEGYFLGSRSYVPSKNGISYVEVELLKKELAGTFDSGNGGSISVDEKVDLTFAANGIVKSDGTPYSGPVEVYGAYLDPESDNLHRIMPGMLFGINEDGNQRGLQTFGMAAIELYDPSGNELQPAEGKPVEMRMEVPTGLQGQAPTTIPLWYFDGESGVWVEEGGAELQNGVYVGKVAHFSFWNCDIPFDAVYLEGQLFWRSDAPLPNVTIFISDQSTGISTFGYSDSEGKFAGYVPLNSPLYLEVLDYCENVIFEQELGVFSENVTLQPITINESDFLDDLTEITGTLLDCNGAPVQNGYINVSSGSEEYSVFPDENGQFYSVITNCSGTTFTLTGTDFENINYTDTHTFSYQPTVNTGDLYACNEPLEYFLYELNGVETLITTQVYATEDQAKTIVAATEFGNGPSISIGFYDTTPGVHTVYNVTIGELWPAQITAITVDTEVTTYGELGELVIGTISGWIQDSNGTIYSLSGSFKAILQ